MTKITFYYFAYPHINRGEAIRYTLNYYGVKHEDARVFSKEPRPKDTCPYPENSPYRQLPILKVSEKDGSEITIPQGPAICQWVADFAREKAGATALSPIERANAMHLALAAEDLRVRLVQGVFYGEEYRNRFVESVAARHFKQFEDLLVQSSSDYFYTEEPTFGDICVVDAVETVEDYMNGLLEQFPKLSNLVKVVLSLPGIAEYKATCPKKNSAPDRPESLLN